MATQNITFYYLTGIKQSLFTNARIVGSWDANGRYNDQWMTTAMVAITGEDGCPAFTVTIALDMGEVGKVFKWGVMIDGPGGENLWGINTEVNDPNRVDRYSVFTLTGAAGQTQKFYLTYKRRLGGNKFFSTPNGQPGLKFSVWAPYALQVEVVFGMATGYIYPNGNGMDPAMPPVVLRQTQDGIWESAVLPDFAAYEGKYYMYRLQNAQGQSLFRTDIFARGLVGRGNVDPENGHWNNDPATLDGTVSCSIITDPDKTASVFPLPATGNPPMQSTGEFWASEFNHDRPLPGSIGDLVIYELHVGALGYTPGIPGNLQDAVALLPYLVDLGINCIELLPMAEINGNIGWGYGDTHHMVIQSSTGGKDEYRYFIRECHRNGIAVIQDVVYNHYDTVANRAEYQYDSTVPEQNSYYYYVGKSTDYVIPTGGYLDNGSSGWTPNFRETAVRQQFISSAVFFLEEMHIDGFRVDLTQAMYQNNQLHVNGNPEGEANQYGCKLLREWGRTVRIVHPTSMLLAEDYSGWDMVTKPVTVGGFGFNATWFADFFHALVGYQGNAMLLLNAGYGDQRALDIATFSGYLYHSQYNSVVFHSNHDNSGACLVKNNNVCNLWSHRTMVTAVNSAPIYGTTRSYAESRSRLVFGLSLLSAGTPLFFMGEEIAAMKPYTYDNFINNREDLQGDRAGIGANMYRYYQDLLTVNRRYTSIRGKNIDVLAADNPGRVILFKRWLGTEQVLVAASFNHQAFPTYTLHTDTYRLPDGGWKEVFNSDAAVYGGSNTGNGGATMPSSNGSLTMVIPANGLIILVKA
jgi:1,4-alpha-glucan branching enzyme